MCESAHGEVAQRGSEPLQPQGGRGAETLLQGLTTRAKEKYYLTTKEEGGDFSFASGGRRSEPLRLWLCLPNLMQW